MHNLDKKMAGRARKSNGKNSAAEIGMHSALCLVWIVFLVILLLCTAAKMVCVIDIAEAQYVPLTTSIASFGILMGTFFFSTSSVKQGAVSALLGGIFFWVLILTIGIIRKESVDSLAILKLFSFSAAAALGSVLGNLTKEYKKSHRRLK